MRAMVWSPRLPDPNLFHWTTFTGLYDWVSSLIPEERREVVSCLWTGPPKDVPKAVWEGPLDVFTLGTMYATVLTDRERAVFDSRVVWTGGPDPPGPPSQDPSPPLGVNTFFKVSSGAMGLEVSVPKLDNKLCYQVLVTPATRARFVARLGSNPRGPTLVSALLEEPGSWAPGRFSFSIHGEVKSNGVPPFIQAHVKPSSDGCTVSQLLQFMNWNVRVGSDGDRALLAVAPDPLVSTGRPTAFDHPPSAPSFRIKFGGYAALDNVAKTGATPTNVLAWGPFESMASALILGTYESVRLITAEFVVWIPKGAVNAMYLAVVGHGNGIKAEEWFSAPISEFFSGSDQGPVSHRWALPSNHSFGREYRAATLGTGPPRFNFSLSNTATLTARITANFEFEVAGQSPTPRFNMMVSTPKAVFTALRDSIGEHARVGPAVAPDEPDDDEEDAPTVPTRVSGPTTRSPRQ